MIENKDELFEKVKDIILKEGKISISYLQRRLKIGYNRTANIIEQFEKSRVFIWSKFKRSKRNFRLKEKYEKTSRDRYYYFYYFSRMCF